MLRTGEILALHASQLLCDKRQRTVVVSFGLTKGGKRQGASESTVIGYDMVVNFIQRWKDLATSITPLANYAAQ